MVGREGEPDGRTSSSLSGSAGDVVQARDVSGGVHFHHFGSPQEVIPAQLPADVHGFVNRVEDLERLDTALGDIEHPGPDSVCVITGTAGVGKTSLAVHWAHRVRARFVDEQLYVNLRGYDPSEPVTATQALQRFLEALGVAPSAIPAEVEARAALYRSHLAGKRMLVVLDNAATVSQVRQLLPGTSGCVVLVTSRNRLSGLVARDGARRITLEVFDEQASVELLRSAIAGYRSGDDQGRLGELALLCAGLPLALRIAAERAAARPRASLDTLIRDLRDQSSLWDALSADDDEEADAVRGVFAWSYRALSPEAARLFRLLGLHPGPQFCTHAAAALAERSEHQARRLLDVLVGAHLVDQIADTRFQFHDLLRAYALDRADLDESVEGRQDALRRVLTWYLYTTNAAVAATHYAKSCYTLAPVESEVGSTVAFEDHNSAIRWYEAERANLVAATRAADQQGFDEIAWMLPALLANIYDFRHPVDEWLATSQLGLAAARRIGHRLGEGRLLYSLGKAHTQFQHPEQGLRLHRAGLEIQRSIGDRAGEVENLNGIAVAYLRLHLPEQARVAAQEAVSVAGGAHNRAVEGGLVHVLAWCHYDLGDLPEAGRLADQAVAIYRACGGISPELDALSTVMRVQRKTGDVEGALQTVHYALSRASEIDDPLTTAYCFFELGKLSQLGDRHHDALTNYQQAANLWRRLGHHNREARALDVTGEVYRELGRLEDALGFHQRAIAIHHDLGDRWRESIALNRLATALRQAGKRTEAREAWRQGLLLLEGFNDPKATALRESIHAELATEPTSLDR